MIAAAAGLVSPASLCKVPPGSERERGSSRGQFLDLSPWRQPRLLAIALVPVAGSVAFLPVLTHLPVVAGAPGHADFYANGFRVALVAAAVVTSLIAAAVVTLRRRAERLDARVGETGRSEEFAMSRKEA